MNKTTTAHGATAGVELDKLEALLNAATPGDWTHKRHGVIVAGPYRQYTNGAAQSQIAAFNVTFHEQAPDDEPERQIANAEFAVAAKNSMASLIALARRAQPRAELAERKPRVKLDPEVMAALEEAAKTRSTVALLPDGEPVFINYGDQPEDNADLCCTACGGSGHIEDQLAQQTTLAEDVAALFSACGFEIRSTDPAEKHPFAVCGSLDAAGLVVEKLLVGQNDPDSVPAEFIALLPGVTYMAPPDGSSVSLLEQFRRMAQDAARYRWLRDKSEPGICAFYLSVGQAFKDVRFAPETVDQAIDAQIARPLAVMEGGAV